LPSLLRSLVRVNPLSYGVDGIRGSLGESYLFGLGQDYLVLGLLTLALLALGSYLFSRIQL
jgi:ABC-2 type transport system permease protein